MQCYLKKKNLKIFYFLKIKFSLFDPENHWKIVSNMKFTVDGRYFACSTSLRNIGGRFDHDVHFYSDIGNIMKKRAWKYF